MFKRQRCIYVLLRDEIISANGLSLSSILYYILLLCASPRGEIERKKDTLETESSSVHLRNLTLFRAESQTVYIGIPLESVKRTIVWVWCGGGGGVLGEKRNAR